MNFERKLRQLEECGIDHSTVARHMGIGRAYLRQVLRGQHPVRPLLEVKLAAAILTIAKKKRRKEAHSTKHREYLEALATYLESLA